MKYTLRSMHYLQSEGWLKQALDIEFGPAGIEELEKMRSTRQALTDLGAFVLEQDPLQKISDIFEDTDGNPGFVYQLNDYPAWISKDEANRFQVEGFNEYFISDCLKEAEAWLFQNYYLEGRNVEFSINEDDPERDVFLAADGRVLWSSSDSRE